MCGIVGFVDYKYKSNIHSLYRMTASLSHRGPDGDGYFIKDLESCTIGLGHRRLSIIDLSNAASQPMSVDGLNVIFNGEIYNFNEIRNDLLHKGYLFRSHSDTEVILCSIKEWGIEAVQKWKGMFSIVLFDENKREIVFIRDRAGVKPFYYYWDNNLLLFGSELKSLIQHDHFKKKISINAVQSYMQYGYVPTPYSIFENCYKVTPGHIVTVNLENKELVTTKYWDIYDYYNRNKIDISIEDAVLETEMILEKAFQYRMIADVPVGVFLSGGFDSTCVTALLQKNSINRIKTFTIGSHSSNFNEAPIAKEVSKRLGTEHTEYYCSSKEALDIIPTLPHWYDEPFADSSAIPTILVSRLARESVTVALSADAGDELFGGYNRYLILSKYRKAIKNIPGPFRKIASNLMNKVSSDSIPHFKNNYNFHSHYEKFKYILEDPRAEVMIKNTVQMFSDRELKNLMAKDTVQLQTFHSSVYLKNEFYDDLSYMMAIDFQTYLPDDILQKVDRATMSVGLEGREPFLDQSIVEWAAQLPSHYKIYNGTKKHILKEIVYKYLPKELMNLPKKGFSIPLDSWLSEELKWMVQDYLNEQKLSHGYFDKDYVLELRDQFFSGKKNLYLKIWTLCMFQMWYYKWMET